MDWLADNLTEIISIGTAIAVIGKTWSDRNKSRADASFSLAQGVDHLIAPLNDRIAALEKHEQQRKGEIKKAITHLNRAQQGISDCVEALEKIA